MSVFNTKKTIEANDKQIIESFMKSPKTVHFSFQKRSFSEICFLKFLCSRVFSMETLLQ